MNLRLAIAIINSRFGDLQVHVVFAYPEFPAESVRSLVAAEVAAMEEPDRDFLATAYLAQVFPVEL